MIDSQLTLDLVRVVSDFGLKNVELDDAVANHLDKYSGDELSFLILADNVLSKDIIEQAINKIN